MSNLGTALKAVKTKSKTPTINGTQPTSNPVPTPYSPSSNSSPHVLATEALQDSIRKERKQQGMSQRMLAVKSGMSQGTITRAERHLWISLNALIRIVVNGLGLKLTITKTQT